MPPAAAVAHLSPARHLLPHFQLGYASLLHFHFALMVEAWWDALYLTLLLPLSCSMLCQVLDRVLARTGGHRWWAALIGRVKAQRMYNQANTVDAKKVGVEEKCCMK